MQTERFFTKVQNDNKKLLVVRVALGTSAELKLYGYYGYFWVLWVFCNLPIVPIVPIIPTPKPLCPSDPSATQIPQTTQTTQATLPLRPFIDSLCLGHAQHKQFSTSKQKKSDPKVALSDKHLYYWYEPYE